MPKKKNYKCPRCGYETHQKAFMRKHLYGLKKTCPGIEDTLELTEEIKQHILDNRVYHYPPKNETQIINQHINNFNTINAFVAGMDIIDKLKKLTEHQNVELIDFEDHVDSKYHLQAKKLEQNKCNNFHLKIPNMLEVIDATTSINQIKEFNIIYDEKLRKIKILSSGQWDSYLLEQGIQKVMCIIQSCYLDSYECYLIRKIVNSNVDSHVRAQLKESLMEYYQFLASFEATPYVQGKLDNEILYNPDDCRHHEDCLSYSVQDEWCAKYKIICNQLTVTTQKKIFKDVHEIIKRNTSANMVDLNKTIVDILTRDDEFKNKIFCFVGVNA
jgi:hypothetical protein